MNLAFVLFFPVFCIIAVLYCVFPRRPRVIWRLLADIAVLISAAGLSISAMRWGFRAGTGVAGPIWKQILATLLAYAAFLSTIGLALLIRHFWLRRLQRSDRMR
jgi:hypothetical protein